MAASFEDALLYSLLNGLTFQSPERHQKKQELQ